MSTTLSKHREHLVSTLPVEDRRIDAAGISTAFLEGGDGPPLILLHGQGEFAATWLQVIPKLVERFHVIAADLPGHGASGIGDDPLELDVMNAWLDELIGQTCDAPPVVAGHLLGGALAARFAIEHFDRMRTLVLVDSLGLAPYRPAPRFALAMISFVAFPSESSRDRLFSRCFVDLDDVRSQVGRNWLALSGYALECAHSPQLKAALKSLMPRFGLPAIPAEDLARIAVPVAMIWGRHDLQVRQEIAERARDRYGWPLHTIENAADDPAVEQPDAFLEAFHSLLQLPASITVV